MAHGQRCSASVDEAPSWERQCRNDQCAANWLNVKQRLDRKQWNISVHVDIDSQVGHVEGSGSNWEKNESNWSKRRACVRSGSSVTQESTHLLPRLNCVVICNSIFTGAARLCLVLIISYKYLGKLIPSSNYRCHKNVNSERFSYDRGILIEPAASISLPPNYRASG